MEQFLTILLDSRIRKAVVMGRYVTLYLADGRIISVPLSWSRRLGFAPSRQLRNFHILENGLAVHWPELRESITGEEALRGYVPPDLALIQSGRDWTADRVRWERLRMNLTITAFSALLGVRRATVSDWERGKESVSPMGRQLLDALLDRFESEVNEKARWAHPQP